VLASYFDKDTSDSEFIEKKKAVLEQDDVNITSKEQMLYYEMFRKYYGKPSEVYTDKVGRQCPNCKSYMKTELGFCKVCGTYPI
jgi:hypothetical protein